MKNSILKKVLIIALVLLLCALLLISSCSTRQPTNPSEPTPEPTVEPTPAVTPEPEPEPTPEPMPEPTAEPEPEGDIKPVPPPVVGDPDNTPAPEVNPANGVIPPWTEPADDEWFSDAAFLGNSLVDGFRLFSGLTTCDVYAATSMTVMGADSLIQQMSAQQYGKVYILLGINEIGFDADYFKGLYGDMLDKIMEQQPDADIYIMSLTPVSEHKSNTDSTFTMNRVRTYNEKLLELAEEKGCYYIDLVAALSDETGYLPAAVTTDGVHFAASHYQVWLEYLRTHHF